MNGGWQHTLRPRLRDADADIVATFVLLPRVEIVETAAHAGFDAVVFDLEHGPFGPPELPPLVAAAHGAGLHAVVRVGEDSPALIGNVCDTGVDGVLVPHVGTVDAARRAVDAVRYPPEGTRSLNPYVRGYGYGAAMTGPASMTGLMGSSEGVAVIVMIEDADGLAKLAEIARVPGVDGVFVGPVDLSAALGHPGEPEHPLVVRTVTEIVGTASAAETATAVYAPTPEAARRWLDSGVRMVTMSADIAMALDGFRRFVRGVSGEK